MANKISAKGLLKYSLNEMTAGEKLWMLRQRNKWNQQDLADKVGMSLRAYRTCERGDGIPYGRLGHTWGHDPHTLLDFCALAKRRSGWTGIQVARRMKISRVTLSRMEEMGADVLVKFWKNQGFVGFPNC